MEEDHVGALAVLAGDYGLVVLLTCLVKEPSSDVGIGNCLLGEDGDLSGAKLCKGLLKGEALLALKLCQCVGSLLGVGILLLLVGILRVGELDEAAVNDAVGIQVERRVEDHIGGVGGHVLLLVVLRGLFDHLGVELLAKGDESLLGLGDPLLKAVLRGLADVLLRVGGGELAGGIQTCLQGGEDGVVGVVGEGNVGDVGVEVLHSADVDDVVAGGIAGGQNVTGLDGGNDHGLGDGAGNDAACGGGGDVLLENGILVLQDLEDLRTLLLQLLGKLCLQLKTGAVVGRGAHRAVSEVDLVVLIDAAHVSHVVEAALGCGDDRLLRGGSGQDLIQQDRGDVLGVLIGVGDLYGVVCSEELLDLLGEGSQILGQSVCTLVGEELVEDGGLEACVLTVGLTLGEGVELNASLNGGGLSGHLLVVVCNKVDAVLGGNGGDLVLGTNGLEEPIDHFLGKIGALLSVGGLLGGTDVVEGIGQRGAVEVGLAADLLERVCSLLGHGVLVVGGLVVILEAVTDHGLAELVSALAGGQLLGQCLVLGGKGEVVGLEEIVGVLVTEDVEVGEDHGLLVILLHLEDILVVKGNDLEGVLDVGLLHAGVDRALEEGVQVGEAVSTLHILEPIQSGVDLGLILVVKRNACLLGSVANGNVVHQSLNQLLHAVAQGVLHGVAGNVEGVSVCALILGGNGLVGNVAEVSVVPVVVGVVVGALPSQEGGGLLGNVVVSGLALHDDAVTVDDAAVGEHGGDQAGEDHGGQENGDQGSEPFGGLLRLLVLPSGAVQLLLDMALSVSASFSHEWVSFLFVRLLFWWCARS